MKGYFVKLLQGRIRELKLQSEFTKMRNYFSARGAFSIKIIRKIQKIRGIIINAKNKLTHCYSVI